MVKRAPLFLLVALAACPLPEYHYPPGPPEIVAFTAVPFEVPPGGSTEVRWRVEDASEVTLAGELVPNAGSKNFVISAPRTIELIARGAGGTSNARIDVAVHDPRAVQILSFHAAPRTASPDEAVTISWDTEHATHVSLSLSNGVVLLQHALKAGTYVYRSTESYTAELRAEGFEGPQIASATVEVRDLGPVIERFSVEPPSVTPPETGTLVWQVRRARSLLVTQLYDAGGEELIYAGDAGLGTGRITLDPAMGSRTIRLVATSSGGEAIETARMIVLEARAPEILELSIEPEVNGPGGDSLVRYATRYADDVQLAFGSNVDAVDPQGVFWRSFPGPTRAVLTARSTASGRTVTREVQVGVDPARPTITLNASPRYVGLQEEARIEWSTVAADEISFFTDVGDPVIAGERASSGVFSYYASSPISLLAFAENTAGTTTRIVPVDFEARPRVRSFSGPALARVGRPAQYSWVAENARRGTLSGGNVNLLFGEEIRGREQLVEFTEAGDFELLLTAQALHLSATASLSMSVLPANMILSEQEPDDTPELANGTYYFSGTGPATIDGTITPNDVDVFAFNTGPTFRLRFDVAGLNAGNVFCEVPASLDFYEEDLNTGLYAALGTIDAGEGFCPSYDPLASGLSGLRGNLVARLRTRSTNFTEVTYLLNLTVEAALCGDRVRDRGEECDDGNAMIGDGCSACAVEGLDEVEPNDVPPLATHLELDTPFNAYLNDDDFDAYAFTIPHDREGPVQIQIMPLLEISCPAARLALARDPLPPLTSVPSSCAELSGPEMVLSAGEYAFTISAAAGLSRDVRGSYTVLVSTP